MVPILRCTNDDGVKYDLDLLDDIDFKLDISAIESGAIGKVFGVSSQRLSLPPTVNNNAFFGNLYDLGATPSTSFIKTTPCQLLQDGMEIFSGVLYIESVVTDNKGNDIYNVVVVNETIDFGYLIEDQTFADLDFSAFDHTYTYGNVTGSWDKTLVGGAIFYPLVNYGFDEENPLDTQIKGGGENRTFSNYYSPVRVDDFKPAIRLRDCLDAIFDGVNYTYTSSLFTSGSYTDDLYMLATKDAKKGISDVNPISQSFRAYETFNQDYVAPTANTIVNFTTESFDNAGNYDGTNTFTAGADGTYQFEVNLVYEIIGYASVFDNRSVDVKIFKNGTQFDTYNYQLNGTVAGQINLLTQYYNLATTDTIDVRVSFVKSGAGSETFRVVGSTNTRFKLVTGPTSLLGGNVNFATAFGNISVSEFLQGLIEKFNLVIEPVPNERNVLSIETFNDWVNTGETKDWSDVVDYDKKWEIRHPLQGQPKSIKFSDIEDNIVLTQYHKRLTGKVYGDYDYFSESDLAEGEKTIGKLFAPTPLKGIEGAPMMILPALAEKDDSSQPFARTSFAPRLLYHNGRQDALGILGRDSTNSTVQNIYYFEDENGVTHEETDYGLASHLQATPAVFGETKDIHFGNNWSPGHWSYHQAQFNGETKNTAFYEYWAYYVNELYDIDSRLVTMNVFMSPTDIPNIRLNDRIFIDGHYYRINKILGANVSREATVTVELLKTLPRNLQFPRRRVTEIGELPVDLIVDDAEFKDDGFVGYVDYETGLAYTGSALTPAASRDGFETYGNKVVWDVNQSPQVKFTSQTNIGLNRVDESADTIDARGEGNVVANSVSVARVEGVDNLIESYAKFVQVTGLTNTVAGSVENSSIINSNTSSLDTGTTLATIIAGNDTHISSSTNSAVIGPQVTLQGGGESVVIGNGTDNSQIEVKDLFNIVAINPNRDLDNIENLGGDDFNTYAYLGSYRRIGAVFSDYLEITGSAGGSLDMRTAPAYKDTYYHFCSWTGGNGDYTIYLPSTAASPPGGIDQPIGYKREMKFFSDTTLTSNTNIVLQPSGSDSIEGTTSYTIDKPLEGLTIFGTPGNWYIVQRKA